MLDETELFNRDNPFALIALTVKKSLEGRNIKNKEERDAFRLKMKLQLAREFISRKMSEERIRKVLAFLDAYILVVRNLIVKLGLPDKKVAEVAEVSEAFVKKVRASLNAAK